MNKCKIIICILFSMFLIGCEATYNVNIDGNVVSEDFNFVEHDNSKYNTTLFSHTDMTYESSVYENAEWPTGALYQKNGDPYEPVIMEGVEYYNQNLINGSEGLGIKYNYNFTLDNYRESNAARSCFKNFGFGNGDKKISIYANNAKYCFNGRKMLDKVTINLKTTYPVISHNADKYDKDNNTYTWTITNKNAESKIIKMELSKDLDYKPEKEDKAVLKNGNLATMIIVFVSFALIVGIIALILYGKSKNTNKI